jgi:hypothetical protein
VAVTAYWYALGLVNAFGGAAEGDSYNIDWLTNTIKVALTTSGYTPNQDTHDFFNDVTNEVTHGGYTAGGAALGTKTLGATNNVVKFSAANTVWTASGGTAMTARRAVIYKDSGTTSNAPLLAWVDFGADVSATDANFTITWDANGVLRITATDATGFP